MCVFLRTTANVLKVKRLLFPKLTELVISNRSSKLRHFVTFNWKNGKNRLSYRFVTTTLILSGIYIHSLFKEDVLEQSIDAVVKDMGKSVTPSMAFLRIKGDNGTLKHLGTGFIANSNGLIITGGDVTKKLHHGMKLDILLHDNSLYEGIVEEFDLRRELVKIRINKTDLPVMKLAESMPWMGEIVFFQIALEFAKKNIMIPYYGVVGSTGYLDNNYTMIVATNILTERFTGGPVLNLDGELIGLVRTVKEPNICCVVPLEKIRDFFEEKAAEH